MAIFCPKGWGFDCAAVVLRQGPPLVASRPRADIVPNCAACSPGREQDTYEDGTSCRLEPDSSDRPLLEGVDASHASRE